MEESQHGSGLNPCSWSNYFLVQLSLTPELLIEVKPVVEFHQQSVDVPISRGISEVCGYNITAYRSLFQIG